MKTFNVELHVNIGIVRIFKQVSIFLANATKCVHYMHHVHSDIHPILYQ